MRSVTESFFIFIYIKCFTAQVRKVCRTPGPTACLMTLHHITKFGGKLNHQTSKFKFVNIIFIPCVQAFDSQTAQISHMACSLLTIMKFESTRREPKGCCLPVRWLVYSTNNNYHLVAR